MKLTRAAWFVVGVLAVIVVMAIAAVVVAGVQNGWFEPKPFDGVEQSISTACLMHYQLDIETCEPIPALVIEQYPDIALACHDVAMAADGIMARASTMALCLEGQGVDIPAIN